MYSPSLSGFEGGDNDSVLKVSSIDKFESNELFGPYGLNDYFVKHFHVGEEMFECEGFRSPTMKKARKLIQSIIQMRNLEEMSLHGKMSFDNIHDVEIIKDAISNHSSLRSITFEGFVVYATDHPGVSPLFESLVESALTLSNLKRLNLVCFASYKRWDRAFCSSNILRKLCQKSSLERLSLSGIGLEDEHFFVLAHELATNQETRITELVLNNNRNTDAGSRAIAGLIEPSALIERLEIHNHTRLTQSTSEYIAQQVERNFDLKHFSANTHHDHRSKVEFFLLLNRIGRKTILDANPETFIDVLSTVDDNISISMRLLQENPSIFHQCCHED